jgi:hypothetical protein
MQATMNGPRGEQAIVLRAVDERDLDSIPLRHVQAVIYRPEELPVWFEELAGAVRAGAFRLARTALHGSTRAEIAAWLEQNLPRDAISTAARQAVAGDILALVDRIGAATGASRYMLRIHTDAPSNQCGFHVDTLPPNAPNWGLLRVYNGAGTSYVESADVTTTRQFYRYMSRRERLARELADADNRAEPELERRRLLGEIKHLDDELPFLRDGARILTAPAGAIVAFKHLDVQLHWSDHDPALAWIHCSPMAGEARLVVNVTGLPTTGRRYAAPGPDGTVR